MAEIKVSPNGQWSCPPETSSPMEDFAKSYVERNNATLEKSSETMLFKRYEDKYIMSKALAKEFTKLLDQHLKTDYLDNKTKFNLMKSTYFDSANFDMVKHHTSKAQNRFKIRTREYAPNGKLSKSDFTFLEVKAKSGDVTDKFRIKLPKTTMEAFKKGAPITATVELVKMNKNIGVQDLVKRIIDINQSLELFHLRPSCETEYIRKSYTDGAVNDSGLRVTMDEGIKYRVLDVVPTQITAELSKTAADDKLANMVQTYSPEEHVVVEVKHHGTIPDWLTKFFADNQLRKAHFSKYCYSITKHAMGK